MENEQKYLVLGQEGRPKNNLTNVKNTLYLIYKVVNKINSLIFACKGEIINSGGLGGILIPLDF